MHHARPQSTVLGLSLQGLAGRSSALLLAAFGAVLLDHLPRVLQRVPERDRVGERRLVTEELAEFVRADVALDGTHHDAPPAFIAARARCTPMTRRHGISFPDEMAAEIDEYRIRGGPEAGEREIINRSQAVQELVEVGLVVSKLIDDSEFDLEPGRPRVAFTRQALLNEFRRQPE